MRLKLFNKYFLTTSIIILFSLAFMMLILTFALDNYISRTKYDSMENACSQVTDYISVVAKEGKISVLVNGKETEFALNGDYENYINIDNLNENDTVILEYELVDFYQKVTINYLEQEPQEYTYHWIGNSVVSVEPKGKYLPVYNYE